MEITFENLPKAITELKSEVGEIKRLLTISSNTPEKGDELLSIQQAAEFLMLSVTTLYAYVQRSSIPVSKKGGRLYFSKNDLLDWVKEGRKKTLSEIQADADQHFSNKKGSRRK